MQNPVSYLIVCELFVSYENLKAGSRIIFPKCDNSSSAQHWISAQLWNATDAPWQACLLDDIHGTPTCVTLSTRRVKTYCPYLT